MTAVAERIVRLCKRRSYGEIRKAVTDRSSSGPTSLDMCFENVSKVYLARGRKVVAVNGVSFTCAQGRFTTVLGASGCGKSTLLSIAAGLVSADGGAVTLGGRPVKEPSPERGMVFQHYA
ncbi:MAG: ATP-binding cassette domain-containing protein, partial [Actinomycetota bacterium]|nr:ATP-binding cassette domain-containing protein [Actinomycetota bacterium]